MKKVTYLLSSLLILSILFCSCAAATTDKAIKTEEPGSSEITLSDMERLITKQEKETEALFQEAKETTIQYWQQLLELNDEEILCLRDNQGWPLEQQDLLQNKLATALEQLQKDTDISDEEKISFIVDSIFQLRQLDFWNEWDADFTVFMDGTYALDPSLQYFIDWSRLSKGAEQIRANEGKSTLDMATKVMINEIDCQEDKAYVSVSVKEMTRQENNDIGSNTRQYEIAMSKASGKWLICSMHSDDPQEQYYLENQIRLDVDKRLEELMTPDR